LKIKLEVKRKDKTQELNLKQSVPSYDTK